LKLLVDRLTSAPAPYRFEEDARWWKSRGGSSDELAPGSPSLRDPLVFELTAHRMGDDVLIRGVFRGQADLDCGRCLARYREALHDEFQLLLEPVGDRVPADPEASEALEADGLCLGDDLEAGWYRGPELELDAFFSEVVALALPLQPLCRENCQGLCPRCGADRNQNPCDCEVGERPSPFSVLAKLRDSMKDPTD